MFFQEYMTFIPIYIPIYILQLSLVPHDN